MLINPLSIPLAKYGDHAPLHVVYNPDDFRQVYVHEDDSLPLVTLTHEYARPDTPAWTFTETKARFDAGFEGWTEPDAKVQFQRDLDDAVTKLGKGRKSGRRSKREENKETVARAKDQLAVERTFGRPLSSATPFGPAPSTNPALPNKKTMQAAISYDDASAMNIVNRNTGEKLL